MCPIIAIRKTAERLEGVNVRCGTNAEMSKGRNETGIGGRMSGVSLPAEKIGKLNFLVGV